MTKNSVKSIIAGLGLAAMLAGCAGTAAPAQETSAAPETPVVSEMSIADASSSTVEIISNEAPQAAEESAPTQATAQATAQVTELSGATGGKLAAADIFTERDLTQTADTSGAQSYELADGQDITINKEGVYVLKGTASNVTVYVEADDTAKVQIVLDGVSITNESMPAIYVKSADKVFVTTTSSENSLSVTGTFAADGDTNLDAAIFSKDDIVLNGTGTLNVSSTANGISSKDDLKVTGGTINVNCSLDALEANDSVAIADGSITLASSKDGIHAEYDDGTGYVYICGGTVNIQAAGNGIRGTELVQIDGGSIQMSAVEGIEATHIQINEGAIDISASDDGINASFKSGETVPVLEINGGELNVTMAQGDTDALDSNGYLYVNGGTVNISAQFAFDFDYGAEMNGGTVTVNGEQVTQITNSMMGAPGGGMMGGPGGMAPGGNMGGRPGF